jgi:hypothetical protein
MPCNYKDYPANWKQIIAEKKVRNYNKCELCFAPNGETVTRLPPHKWAHPWGSGYITFGYCHGEKGHHDYPKTKIILTVHHIDGDKNNNTDANLILLCQRCHLRLDLCKHMSKTKETREKKGIH